MIPVCPTHSAFGILLIVGSLRFPSSLANALTLKRREPTLSEPTIRLPLEFDLLS